MQLSIIVASSGRDTLARTLASIQPQLAEGDEVLVSVNSDCPYGHAARNQLMAAARGHMLMFIDDDDTYAPGALAVVRTVCSVTPGKMHIFKMRYADGHELWREPEIREGNVSTQMVAVPNLVDKLGAWGDRYEGDFDFIASTEKLQPGPLWHREVIALVRPTDG